jgi:hypothetical protein
MSESNRPAENRNVGHGHVFPRPDGVKARCGGPGICSECSRDQSRKIQQEYIPEPPSSNPLDEPAWENWSRDQLVGQIRMLRLRVGELRNRIFCPACDEVMVKPSDETDADLGIEDYDGGEIDCPTCGQGHVGPAARELRKRLTAKTSELCPVIDAPHVWIGGEAGEVVRCGHCSVPRNEP